MDENRRKIRDKGTITKIVGHKFTVFSLEDQSRAKINMLLEIVYSLFGKPEKRIFLLQFRFLRIIFTHFRIIRNGEA
jgi:hypothetical protein